MINTTDTNDNDNNDNNNKTTTATTTTNDNNDNHNHNNNSTYNSITYMQVDLSMAEYMAPMGGCCFRQCVAPRPGIIIIIISKFNNRMFKPNACNT